MPKKQQISLKELKKQVSLIINDQDLDYFDLNLQEQDDNNNILDKALEKVPPIDWRVIPDSAADAQRIASDTVANKAFQIFGPASPELVDLVTKAESQVTKVITNTSMIFNEQARSLDKKLQFSNEKHKQAIFRIGNKDPNNVYPGIDDIKKYFLLFSDFCGDNSDFSVNEFAGSCPMYSDPGGWCLSSEFKSSEKRWNSKRRDLLIGLRNAKTDEQVKGAIGVAVDEFIASFSNFSIKLPGGQTAAGIQNFSNASYKVFLQTANAKDTILNIYDKNKAKYSISGNTLKARRQLARKAPSILDCFCLLFKGVNSIFYMGGSRFGTGKEFDVSKVVSKEGIHNFLSKDFRLKIVTNLLKNNKDFRANWFSFTANMFYDPANTRGHEFWRKEAGIFVDGEWKKKDGFTMLSTVAYSTVETAIVAKAVQKTMQASALLAKPETRALLRSPQAFIFIMLAIGAASALIYIFDPLGWFDRAKKIKSCLKKIEQEFSHLKSAYGAAADEDEMVNVDKSKVERSITKIESQGKLISKYFTQISSKYAEYGIENEKIDLKVKKQVVAQIQGIAQWILVNTSKESFAFMPAGKIPDATAKHFHENLVKTSGIFLKLIEEIDSKKDNTKNNAKLVLPHLDLDNRRMDLPTATGLGRPSGTILDLLKEEREGTLYQQLNLSPGKVHSFFAGDTSDDVKDLHTRLHGYFHNTFYNLSAQGKTATDDLDDSSVQMVRRELKSTFQEIRKNIKEYGIESVEVQSKRNWTDWAKDSFPGTWPSRKRLQGLPIDKGIVTSSLYDNQFQNSKNNMGMISSDKRIASIGEKRLYAVFGPCLGLRNTVLFEASPSEAQEIILERSKFYLYPDYAKEVINKGIYVRAPDIKLLGTDSSNIGDKFLKEQNLIAEYSVLLEKFIKSGNGSGDDRPERERGEQEFKLKTKARLFKHILNIYQETLRLMYDAIRASLGGGPEEYYNSVENFRQLATQLQNLDESEYLSGTGSKYRRIINSLEDTASIIFRNYINYARILRVFSDNDIQINFNLILSDIGKNNS